MRRSMLMTAVVAAGALSLGGALAQQAQLQASEDDQEVTGTVTAADEETHEIVIDDQTFVMEPHGGTSVMPEVGDEVTLFYREEGDEKVITRIGQPQQ